ncbi:unnamed protein product, partial [Prorocentrum cordatum]
QAEGAEERSGQLQRGTVQFKHARDENLPTKSGSCLSVRRVAEEEEEEEEGGEERQAGGGAPRGLFGPGRPHAERPIRLVQRLQKLGRRPSLPHRPGHQLPCPEPWAPYKALYPWAGWEDQVFSHNLNMLEPAWDDPSHGPLMDGCKRALPPKTSGTSTTKEAAMRGSCHHWPLEINGHHRLQSLADNALRP